MTIRVCIVWYMTEILGWFSFQLAEYFVGFLVCGIIGLLFIIIFPIVGLVFCCCRCCGRCGGKAGSHDPKSAKCKRVSCGIALIVINTLSL